MAKVLDRPLTVSVRGASCGAATARVANVRPSNSTCSYMSSLMIHTDGWRSSTAASARYSLAVYTAPLGLDGELSISHLLFLVMALSSASGRSLKPSSARVGNQTGTPSQKWVMWAYATQEGAGISTSSPGASVAISALHSTCLPPALAEKFSGLHSMPFTRLNLATIAAFSSGVPSTWV